MSQPVVWEGSVFAKSLAEALAEEASSQPEEARQSLETVVPPDAAAARLLIGLGPQCEDELKDEMVESESPSSEDWGGRWVAAVRGLTRSTARGVTIQAYVRQCKQLVQVSKFGSRAGQDLVVSASAVGAHGSTPGALPGDNSQNNNMQLASGREQDWLDHGMLAGGAGYLLTAAAAAVVPLRLLDSDRPRLAAAVGLTSLPVLALAACRLHGKTADARLTLLLQRNCDALGHSIDCVTTMQQITQRIIRTIQEVELLARGYNVVPSSANALPPISRLERRDRERRCQNLRSAVATCLLRARTAVSEVHQQVDTQLSMWYSDGASHCAFDPDAALVVANAGAPESGTAQRGRQSPLGDIKALKAASRAFQSEYSALLATVLYRIAKLGRRSDDCGLPVSRGFAAQTRESLNWSHGDAVESFVSQLSIFLEHLGQEIASLNVDLEGAQTHSAPTGVAVGSNFGEPDTDGNSNDPAAVRFQAGLVDIYHAAHKLSSRALLFHGMVCTRTGDAPTNSAAGESIDLGSIVALKKQASTMLDTMRLDLQSCTTLVDASDGALADLIARLDVASDSSTDPDSCHADGDGRPSKVAVRADVFIESNDPTPLPVTTEVFECELETLSSGLMDDKSEEKLTVEEQRERRIARMAAKQLERQARLKRVAEAEKAAATAKRFYDELQAVVASRDI